MNKSESKYFNTAIKMDQALISLLEEKSFEYITVSEICKKAGVNRSTFYLHYENTWDLLNETTKYLLDSFLSYFPDNAKDEIRKIKDSEPEELNFVTKKYLHPYLSYIKDNARVFSTALSNARSFDFDSVFQRLFQHIFNPVLARFNYPVEDRRYVLIFYLTGINAIVSEWLKCGCEMSIEDVTRIIQECIFGFDKDMQFHLK